MLFQLSIIEWSDKQKSCKADSLARLLTVYLCSLFIVITQSVTLWVIINRMTYLQMLLFVTIAHLFVTMWPHCEITVR